MPDKHSDLVSIHGGHSGQFCQHARDTLEAIVQAYIRKGFLWVGITEHMPPLSDQFLYPDEREAGLSAAFLYDRFSEYITTGRCLQQRYRSKIDVYIGFETEIYTGAEDYIRSLMATFQPDYMVGSLHHVNDLGFDYSPQDYRRCAQALGGIDALYCRYFDLQYDMITALRPTVVGHFDLIRIFDHDYRQRLQKPAIHRRVMRNLKQIRSCDLILDVNLRPFAKGGNEPYPCRTILYRAQELGIAMVPGDDSHGIESVGCGMTEGLALLRHLNIDNRWRRPTRSIP